MDLWTRPFDMGVPVEIILILVRIYDTLVRFLGQSLRCSDATALIERFWLRWASEESTVVMLATIIIRGMMGQRL